MIIKFSKMVTAIKKLEKRKKIEITRSENARLKRFMNKLDRFNNIINHWKSRIERIMNRYLEGRDET